MDRADVAAISVAEAARRLNLPRSSVYRLIRNGQLQAARIGADSRRSRLLVPVSELEAFLQRRLQSPRSQLDARFGEPVVASRQDVEEQESDDQIRVKSNRGGSHFRSVVRSGKSVPGYSCQLEVRPEVAFISPDTGAVQLTPICMG